MGPDQQSWGFGEGTGAESTGAGLGVPVAGRSGAAGPVTWGSIWWTPHTEEGREEAWWEHPRISVCIRPWAKNSGNVEVPHPPPA